MIKGHPTRGIVEFWACAPNYLPQLFAEDRDLYPNQIAHLGHLIMRDSETFPAARGDTEHPSIWVVDIVDPGQMEAFNELMGDASVYSG